MRQGTLQEDEGVLSNRERPLAEMLSLLLETRRASEEAIGQWLREHGLHSQHLEVWEQEVREAVTKGEQAAREDLKAVKKKIREQERELSRKEKALEEVIDLSIRFYTIFPWLFEYS